MSLWLVLLLACGRQGAAANSALVGHTWLLMLSEGTVDDPIDFTSHDELLFGITATPTNKLFARIAESQIEVMPVQQEPCSPTADLNGAWVSGAFSVGPADVILSHELVEPIYGLTISGMLTEGGGLQRVALSGLFDTSIMARQSNHDFCAEGATLGEPCVACPHGVGDYCFPLDIHDILAVDGESPIVQTTDPCGSEECANTEECTYDDTGSP